MENQVTVAAAPLAQAARDPLAFQAPYLLEKLVREGIAHSEAEASALFEEVKRYFVLCRGERTRTWEMQSLRIDEAWHQFVLFTTEYTDFSELYFGRYQHHLPSNAPTYPNGTDDPPMATHEEFAARYRSLFGRDLPDVWRDDLSVHPNRRLIRIDYAGTTYDTRLYGGKIELLRVRDAQAGVLARLDEWAAPALRFILEEDVFYVRELPPPLDDEDRVVLCSALVKLAMLRVAP